MQLEFLEGLPSPNNQCTDIGIVGIFRGVKFHGKTVRKDFADLIHTSVSLIDSGIANRSDSRDVLH